MMNYPFMDIRKYGYFRVATFNLPVCIANPRENRIAMEKAVEFLARNRVDYAVSPELSLTSYSCGDLFFQKALIKEAEKELAIMVKNIPHGIMVAVGLPVVFQGNLFNCVAMIVKDKILGIVPKSYLPNYREFYEQRHFADEDDIPSFGSVIDFAGQKAIPFGVDVIFSDSNSLAKIYLAICEDDWIPIPESRVAALNGANILSNSSASPITIGKDEYRIDLMKVQSGSCMCAQLYASAVGESVSDLSWDGQLLICERGSVAAMTEEGEFSHKGAFLIHDVNVESLVADRMMQNTFRRNAKKFRRGYRFIEFSSGYPGVDVRDFYARIDPHPFVPTNPITLDKRCRQTFNIQASALMGKLKSLPAHLRKVVIGLSGGSDSTLALLVAVHAIDKLGLSRKDIICITMPGFGTTSGTRRNAIDLAKALGVTLREVPIKKSCNVRFGQIGYVIAKSFAENKKLPFENVQAWDRTDILFAIACVEGGIVLGTGDLSEAALGWCTFKGDHMSHYGINCGVPKTLVLHLIKWSAKNIYGADLATNKVLLKIITTPISPELLPTENGKIVQKSEDQNGPYELHDFFLYWFIRFGFEPIHIARLALSAFDGKYTIGEIKRWMKVFLCRFFQNQFKRNCVPDGPKVGLVSLSPRGDWRMPSDAEVACWMRNWEEIPE